MHVVIITLLATLSMQAGFLAWKIASSSLPPIGSTRPLALIKAFITNKIWVLGWFCTCIGWVLFIKATDIGAISLVQPLISSGDVFLVIMSVFFLGERLSKRELTGLVLVIFGAGIFSFHVHPLAPATLNWTRITIFYSVAIAVAAFIFTLTIKRERNLEIMLAVSTGLVCGIASTLTKLMTAYLAQGDTAPGTLDFILNPIFPIMVIANIAGLLILQMAFQKGRASVIVPIDLSVMNILVFIAGLALFNETITIYHFLGLTIITAGVFFLQPRSKETPQITES